jgi:hypothetical protein
LTCLEVSLIALESSGTPAGLPNEAMASAARRRSQTDRDSSFLARPASRDRPPPGDRSERGVAGAVTRANAHQLADTVILQRSRLFRCRPGGSRLFCFFVAFRSESFTVSMCLPLLRLCTVVNKLSAQSTIPRDHAHEKDERAAAFFTVPRFLWLYDFPARCVRVEPEAMPRARYSRSGPQRKARDRGVSGTEHRQGVSASHRARSIDWASRRAIGHGAPTGRLGEPSGTEHRPASRAESIDWASRRAIGHGAPTGRLGEPSGTEHRLGVSASPRGRSYPLRGP